MSFKQLQVNDAIIQALEKQKINKPTEVQKKVYADILAHKDMIVQSETGSGKTLAYVVPIFEKYKELEKTNQVLILVPTHELAMQVTKQIELLASNSGSSIKVVPIIGKANIERQVERLREKPQIVVGTTDRILELIKKKKIAAHTVKTIVLDEADKLLDKNNKENTLAVIKCTMRDRQLLFFSASMPDKVVTEAKELAKDPVVVKTATKQTIPTNIQHMYVVTEKRDRIETFRKLARIQKGKKVMVFVNGKFEIEETTQKLKYHQFKAECIHGNVDKRARQKAVEDFKNGKINYLVATDIAARGLHFDGVDTVFHLSIPEDPMDYLHRAGRTGRNGMKGTSILVVTKEELPRLRAYQKAFGINLVAKKMYQGKLVRG
ncbi:MAG: DEAD/DEAH box helicase [Lachnospiraceae bacterium]|nr:DEAD/DEAH box helicase [Lachnospiraceae bacterium]